MAPVRRASASSRAERGSSSRGHGVAADGVGQHVGPQGREVVRPAHDVVPMRRWHRPDPGPGSVRVETFEHLDDHTDGYRAVGLVDRGGEELAIEPGESRRAPVDLPALVLVARVDVDVEQLCQLGEAHAVGVPARAFPVVTERPG